MLMIFGGEVKGQCTRQIRTYANFQGSYLEGLGLLGSPTLAGAISNPGYAVNGNVKQGSTLSIGVGLLGLAASTQFLEFTTDGTHANKRLITANTPVTIKLTLPKEVLGLLSGVEIGTFTNLNAVSASWPVVLGAGHYAGFNSTNRVAAYSGASLLGLLSGAGEFEATIIPGSDYNGVYIKLSGNALSVALTADVFHAYIMENASGSISCSAPIDVLAGVKAGTVVGGIANATGSVTNQWDAIDSDPNSFALISTGAQVLSQVYETTIFNTPSLAGDSVKIILQDPGGTLLDLNLLTGFTIQPYLKNVAAGSPFLSNDIFLSLKLLPSSGNKYELTLPVASSYDRIEISMGGVAGALSGLRIYDIKRIIPRPPVLIDNANVSSKSICIGSSAALTINTPQSCTDYRWYKVASGGSTVQTGTSYTPALADLVTGPNIFYVEAQRQGCTESISARTPVTITVNALPTAPTVSGTSTCSGSAASLAVTSPDANLTYKWYTASSGGLLVNTGTTFITSGLTTATDYYVEATNNNTSCTSSTRTKVSVSIKSLPTVSAIIGSTNLCVGVGLTYTNSSVDPGIWSTSDPSIVTIDANGFAKGISVGTATITYTITNAASGCSNSTFITLTVFSLPTITLNPIPSICIGATNASLSYSASSSGTLKYDIVWDDPNFSNVSNVSLPTSPISLNIPGNATTGNHTGTFIIRNTTSNCTNSYLITVKINPKLPTPLVSLQ